MVVAKTQARHKQINHGRGWRSGNRRFPNNTCDPLHPDKGLLIFSCFCAGACLRALLYRRVPQHLKLFATRNYNRLCGLDEFDQEPHPSRILITLTFLGLGLLIAFEKQAAYYTKNYIYLAGPVIGGYVFALVILSAHFAIVNRTMVLAETIDYDKIAREEVSSR